MSKEIYISSTPHETRLAIVENDALAEIYYERENEYTLAGSIYKGRVTRVLPGMQSSFVDIGLERDAFLYITDFMEEAGDSADFETDGGQRSGRRERGGNREPVTIESATGDEGERPSGRGRGRRDRKERGGTGERQTASEYAQTPDGQEESFSEEGFSQSYEIEAAEGVTESAERPEAAAPSSEGGRRWRGRRGRRRGRGSQRPEGQAQGFSPESSQGSEPSEGYDEPSEPIVEIDGSAEEALPQESGAEESEQPREAIQRDERERHDGREDRSRGDRGRNRGQRRVPRGFAPRTSFYGLDEMRESEGVAPETLVLPGESLSKYRTDGEDPATAPARKAVEAPAVSKAPGFEIPTGWDGGSVLPGEKLSRYRHEPKQPVVTEVAQDVAEEPQAMEPAPVATAEPAEYEPAEDASVSYRVEPNPPSEFRQSTPFAEPEVVEVVSEPVEEVTASADFEHFVHEELTGTEETAAAHEVTTVHATGEMESSAPVIDEVEQEAIRQAFEPGVGVVEEEIIDDEDYQTTLHASSIEELDELDEEETLEGAADLGTMIREMSIDEITQVSDEEEDDFIEEDAHAVQEQDLLEGETLERNEELEEDTEEEVREEYVEGAENGNASPSSERLEYERRRGRGRRDGRRGDRGRGRYSGSGERDRRGVRSSMQATNLPAISDLLKPGQEVLVQIAKEPIAKKGARITSHIALPGRFLVFMPTVNHTGVSRKIESDSERRRLKEILLSEKGDAPGGFIVRTAAAGATEEELRNDLRFLLNLWADIKQRSDSSKSPALIYHDLNLVERILRDQVTDNFSAIWVDSEENYERILRFLQRFQPSLIRRVKLYMKETPLFEQFGITEEINKALRSKVWLKSGGSIVINQTEALVAIDINTGKYVGKTARLEDTIVKTNLDAIPEIVRQIRLRDLGGIIIIDFIDMDERKNRNRVMAALEEELKNDRAPSKVLQFNDFGLVAITRKRVKQSLERTLSTTCSICQGTGMVKSPVTVCNDIYIEMRKMTKHLDRGDVMLRVHPDVVKQLKSSTKWLQEMEEMVGKTILVKSDPSLHPEQFDIH